MIKILFICHGNICRSPMAEFILKDRIKKANLDIYTDSKAVSNEEYGNDMHIGAKRVLDKYHIEYTKRAAKKISQEDYENFDVIYCMDQSNLYYLNRIVNDYQHKIKLLDTKDIEDPWYTGDFEGVYKQISQAIDNLLAKGEKHGYQI